MLLTYVVCGMEFNLEVDRRVQCSRIVQLSVMFKRMEVQSWAKMRCSDMFKVQDQEFETFWAIF